MSVYVLRRVERVVGPVSVGNIIEWPFRSGVPRIPSLSRALETPSSDIDTRMGREHPRRGSLAYPGMGRRRLRGPRLGKTRKTLSALVETNETTDDGAMTP